MTGTATFVRRLADFRGDARLYAIDPPVKYRDYTEDGDETEVTTDHVVVSAAQVFSSGPETYIFAANKDGKILNWGELDGSFRGGFDHAEALRGAGYEIAS